MIFVTVGTQKFQFNRILKYVDKLIDDGVLLKDDVFGQIGYSTYIPKFKYKKFLNSIDFNDCVLKSDIIISHGGVGSIMNTLKNGKRIVVVPRDVKFNEHVDNHQYEICEELASKKYLLMAYNYDTLKQSVLNAYTFKPVKLSYNNDNKILLEIKKYLGDLL